MRKLGGVMIVLFIMPFLTLSLKSQIIINEICAKNTHSFLDKSTYNYPSWIELYNSGSTTVNLLNYSLVFEGEVKETWTFNIPIYFRAKTYLLISTDGLNNGLHAGFILNGDPGTMQLLNFYNKVIDQIQFGKQFQDVSYGRNPLNANQWVYFKIPSPNRVNNNSIIGISQTAQPLISIPGGHYQNATSIQITASQGTNTYYTLDGSIPDSTSSRYISAISISSNTVFRARSYRNGEIPSEIVTATYLINEHISDLPILSISCPPEFLYDNMLGIYVDGINGITGNCASDPMNWNQDWERAANIEYFDIPGSKRPGFNHQAGIKIYGGCSRGNPQRSFAVRFKEEYNADRLNYRLFDSKPNTGYNSFVLRNSGNDYGITLIRDAVIQTVTEDQMDVDYLAHKPVVVYINGEYWGIYHMQEKADEDFVESNYYYTPEMIDVLDAWGGSKDGINQRYDNLLNYIRANDMSIQENYNTVKEQIDIEEYINYQIIQIFAGNTDWPGNNMKYWSLKDGLGKWRWILYDTDFGFGVWGYSPAENTLTFAMQEGGTDWPNPDWSTFLFRNLMKNQEFNQQFLKTFLVYLGSAFRSDKIISIIDSLQGLITNEMPYHIQRWSAPGDLGSWQNNINEMKNYVYVRPYYVLQFLKDYYSLPEANLLAIRNTDIENCYLKINDVEFWDTLFYGYFFSNVEVCVIPILKEGNEVAKWDLFKQNVEVDTLIQAHSFWKYLDDGTDQGNGWANASFDDNLWEIGLGKFGYGDNDNATTIDFGPDTLNKYVTTYFRNKFEYIIDPKDDSLIINVLRDDGVVIYLNGVEIIRDNMPGGIITYSTLAGGGTSDETSYLKHALDADILVNGENTLAVELHQSSVTSSDIGFDLEMHVTQTDESTYRELFDSELTFNVDSLTYLNLVTEQLHQPALIYLNEVLSDNDDGLTDEFGDYDGWVEIYNPNDYAMDISGLCLTNDKSNPTLYTVPNSLVSNSIVPANGFLVIWTDREPLEGNLHTSFKLNSESGFVGLYNPDFHYFIDSLSFGIQESDISIGRKTDGDPEWTMQAKRTPGASNISLGPITNLNDLNSIAIIVYPNPSEGEFYIKLPEALTHNYGINNEEVSIIDVSGQEVYHTVLKNNLSQISLQGVSNGLYFIKIQVEDQVQTAKIIISK